MSESKLMTGYPIMLHLQDKPVAVIGGGRVAARKVKRLRNAGARIYLISPEISPSIRGLVDAGDIVWIQSRYERDMFNEYMPILVISATDDERVNQTVAQDAHRIRALCNVANGSSDNSDFSNMAQIDQPPLTIALSSNGYSPALLRLLKAKLADDIGEEYAVLADWLGALAGKCRDRWKRLAAGASGALRSHPEFRCARAIACWQADRGAPPIRPDRPGKSGKVSGIALILAGHGSHVSANTAGVVWGYVDRLRKWGVADEVAACFWKEAPAISQVLETVEADDVVIVPVFTARGYFTSEVIPTELGIADGDRFRQGRRIRLTPAVGEHPRLRSIVERQLRATIERYDLSPDHTAAAIIGHGTRRNRQSRDTARHQARRIRDLNWLREVVDVYLDDEPDIPSVYHSTSAENIIALPYFLAEGSHVRIDVPRALGIADPDGVNRVNGRSVYYCEPVGADESICQVILELARAAGLPFAAQESRWQVERLPKRRKTRLATRPGIRDNPAASAK